MKLNDHENYVTHNLELVTIIHALKMWRPNLNARQASWLAMFSKFDFKIMYIKGKENMIAYSLNIRVQVNHIAAMSTYE